MDIVVRIVMEPEEEWVCIPQGSNTVTLNRANVNFLTSAQDLLACILNQAEAALQARCLGDDESLSSSGSEESV
jgi:hypothetical protein